MGRPRKTNIEVNDKKSLADLMQETYNDANDQMHKAQRVVNQLESGESPDNTDTDDISKIAKQKTDALKVRDSAIKIKIDIAKLQSEVLKHGGDEQTAVESANQGNVDLSDFETIREMLGKYSGNDEENNNKNEEGN